MSTQIIIFGASGDLSRRKLLPALDALARRQEFEVIGVARKPKTDEQFREESAKGLERLTPRLHYFAADVSSPTDLASLRSFLDARDAGKGGRLFYLSLMPEHFLQTVVGLSQAGLLREPAEAQWRRVIVEKPFGHDLITARHLSRALTGHLREDQIYRIDHYLGKETVQNLLGLRFHNAIFEPLWNHHHVELVQITVAETLGMESGRGAYYDHAGALRDMLQNHMLQVLSLVAMEPPSSLDAETIRSQKVSVLSSLRVPSADEVRRNTVRAQYGRGVVQGKAVPSYREELGVSEHSTTETYAAVRAKIDNWRWSGVPFLLRHGKRMAKSFTEVQVQFRTPPMQLFNRPEGMDDEEFRKALRDKLLCQIRPNVLTLKIQPREAVTLSFGVKRPGKGMVMAPARLSFDYREHFQEVPAPAYERLLEDALLGDATLFLRADEIEAGWRWADAIRQVWDGETGFPLHVYEAGSWGPDVSMELFRDCEGGWSRDN